MSATTPFAIHTHTHTHTLMRAHTCSRTCIHTLAPRRGNGKCKAKTPQGGHMVCINPYHYMPRTLKQLEAITNVLCDNLRAMYAWVSAPAETGGGWGLLCLLTIASHASQNEDLESIALSDMRQPTKFEALTGYIHSLSES